MVCYKSMWLHSCIIHLDFNTYTLCKAILHTAYISHSKIKMHWLIVWTSIALIYILKPFLLSDQTRLSFLPGRNLPSKGIHFSTSVMHFGGISPGWSLFFALIDFKPRCFARFCHCNSLNATECNNRAGTEEESEDNWGGSGNEWLLHLKYMGIVLSGN